MIFLHNFLSHVSILYIQDFFVIFLWQLLFLMWVLFSIFFSGEYSVFFSQVSILYADIVHFTQLSETLTAHQVAQGNCTFFVDNSYFLSDVFPSCSSLPQLVATLNKLFGTFDQLAQVKKDEW